jgi:hypothetical protein
VGPLTRNLTLADGQVAATATAVYTGVGNVGRRLNVTLANTNTTEETVVLTFARKGGTARRLARVVLAPNEQFELCGLPLDREDVLYGVTTTADVVDYIVSIAADEAQSRRTVYDESGMEKTYPDVVEQLGTVLS